MSQQLVGETTARGLSVQARGTKNTHTLQHAVDRSCRDWMSSWDNLQHQLCSSLKQRHYGRLDEAADIKAALEQILHLLHLQPAARRKL